MSNFFLGEVRPFGGNFAPANWALCNGQIIQIADNAALYTLLGTTYGGDGQTTFALPNLQGRLAMSQGTGSGLSTRTLGEAGGSEQVALLQANLPAHSHSLNATTAVATASTVSGSVLLAEPTASGALLYTLPGTPAPVPETMAAGVCGSAGQSLAHSNLMPSLCVSFIIALAGIFPSQN